MMKPYHKKEISEEHKPMGIDSRKIFLSGCIDDSSAQRIVEQLFSLSNQSEEPIILIVNSTGGILPAMFAIQDAIHIIKAPVNILVLGRACSAAATLTIAMPQGSRFITPLSTLLIHDVRSGCSGSVSEIRNHSNRGIKMQEHVENAILANTKLTRRQMRRLMDGEKTITATEAVEWGLVDTIITSLDEIQ